MVVARGVRKTKTKGDRKETGEGKRRGEKRIECETFSHVLSCKTPHYKRSRKRTAIKPQRLRETALSLGPHVKMCE